MIASEPTMIEEVTGYIPVDGYRVWYRKIGSGGIPLLVLHGGPGAGHDYLETLEELAVDRTVIFYDQLGCGKSDQPDDVSLWQMDRFVREIDTVRDFLGLKQIHLLGQSWGGWLGIEYMLTQPSGIVSLVLASTSASVPQFVSEAARLKSELPGDIPAILNHYEALGEWRNPEYEKAVSEFYKRHLCRLDPWPSPYLRTLDNLDGNAVYETMNGPNEFIVIGNLSNWNRVPRLGEITAPTLVTVGRYDEITPACSQTIVDGIPGARMLIFEESSHTAHLEEKEAYLAAVGSFMKEAEQQTQSAPSLP
ncbi:proline iminopeptidase-family hydrolase [Luteolibacter pohnpeiensis]|nr:proline iminopeptidase-family hydrolase [Luteolibacter pohnpeiensis]